MQIKCDYCGSMIEEQNSTCPNCGATLDGVNRFAGGQPRTIEELKAWYQMSGLPLKKFFNTSGLIYKDMQLKDKLPQMSEDEQLQLLATNGMLVKRPLVIGKDFVLTGFREKEWEEKMQ